MPLHAGTRLGPYEILSPLGAGGMGEVYRARDGRLGREVAVKVLPAALASDPERLKRFERESRSASSLNHPNIVKVLEFGETAVKSQFMTMEYLEGRELAKALANKQPLPRARIVHVVCQIALALEAAHEQGIVHRDLKPANVKVREDGTVKVFDFGLAKLAESSGSIRASDVSLSPTITVLENP